MKNYWFLALALIGLVLPTSAQADAALPPTNIKILIISGGWAHDYETWYHKTDMETLRKAGYTNVEYTEDWQEAAKKLPSADLLIMSGNKSGADTPEFIQAISNYFDGGKNAILLHATLWYNWIWKTHTDQFNAQFVGGGARDHDGVGPFTETVVKEHPVTRGLPKNFPMTDELYHTHPMPGGSPMEVLTEASRPGGESYASIWITHRGNSRILCMALGHDGNSHNSPYYQQILLNAVKWTSGKD